MLYPPLGIIAVWADLGSFWALLVLVPRADAPSTLRGHTTGAALLVDVGRQLISSVLALPFMCVI